MKAIIYTLVALMFCGSLKAESFCFNNLSAEESLQDWAKEYQMGMAFAKERETSLAITSFKRALVLSTDHSERQKEIYYAIILTYYLAEKYADAVQIFEKSPLLAVNEAFPSYHDLMIMLYHSYEIGKAPTKADSILKKIEAIDPNEANQLKITQALLRKDLEQIKELSQSLPNKKWLGELTETLTLRQKSQKLAKYLNMFVPGLGYYYLGQKKAAFTAFAINTTLVLGAAKLFMMRYYALASLATLFELGWYVGGLYGAGQSTEIYNEALFSDYADQIFYQEDLNFTSKLKYEF